MAKMGRAPAPASGFSHQRLPPHEPQRVEGHAGDGLGDIELMVTIRRQLGDRMAYLGGLPTAEAYAAAYRALGVPVYSSAVCNFIPATAMALYRVLSAGDESAGNPLLDTFSPPYLEIRNRRPGYAVSIIKAGARLVGRSGGPVRLPLVDLTAEEEAQLHALIERVEPR